jgi:hypothetical protein
MALTWTPEQSTLARAENAATSARYASSRPWIISGLALSAGTGLNVAVSAGAAWIAGYYVEWDASAQQAVTGSATNHVWIALARDGNDNVTGVAFVINTTGTPPSGDFVKLGTATTDGSAVTGTATTGRSPENQGAAQWGDIDGTLSDQTDLQTALNGKVATTGNESIDGIKTFTSIPVVPNDSFSFAKLQNIATSRILGRVTAGSGDIEELTAAQVLTLLGLLESPKANASSSNQTINSTTMADVTGLSLTGLSASAVYEITVKFAGIRASGTQNMNIRSVVTGRSGTVTATGFSLSESTQNAGNQAYAADNGTELNAVFVGTDGNATYVQFHFRFATGGSGGTFKIQAAMNGGSASAIIYNGASIIATRIS